MCFAPYIPIFGSEAASCRFYLFGSKTAFARHLVPSSLRNPNPRCIYFFGFEAISRRIDLFCSETTPLNSYSSSSTSLDVVSTSSTQKPFRAVMSTKYSAPEPLRFVLMYSAQKPLHVVHRSSAPNDFVLLTRLRTHFDLVLHSILGSETSSPHSPVSLANRSASSLTLPCAPKPTDLNFIMCSPREQACPLFCCFLLCSQCIIASSCVFSKPFTQSVCVAPKPIAPIDYRRAPAPSIKLPDFVKINTNSVPKSLPTCSVSRAVDPRHSVLLRQCTFEPIYPPTFTRES
jgi:hypothetical protein